jgi:hypothetical protein
MTTPGPIPALTRQPVVVPPGTEYADVLADLAAREKRIRAHRVSPSEDHLLKVASDRRAATLDLRLVGRPAANPTKIEAAAGRIAALHTLGELQLVFTDATVPRAGFSVFDELRDQLAARGVPATRVRHLNGTRGEAERALLLDAARGGLVDVLVTNASRLPPDLPGLAVALHHLDCPRTGGDLRRREGTAVTAGVRVLRYVLAGSGEPAAWRALIAAARAREPAPASRRGFSPLTQVRAGVTAAAGPAPASPAGPQPGRHH